MNEYDFNLHDTLHLRLVNATAHEAKVVQRQLGPIASPVEGTPDLIIRFVEPRPEPSDLRYIGLNDAAFTTDEFFVLKGKNKTKVKVSLPFEQIGQKQMEICCERGINNIPLLIPVINTILLAKGILPFHASAFQHQGKGVLVTGWAKGGKTETLLSFMANGAKYIGDEWVYLCPGGAGMFGVPEPIRVWSWHLDSLPKYRDGLKRKEKMKLNALGTLSQAMQWLAGSGEKPANALGRMAQRVDPLVQRQMFVHFPPHSVFGADHIQGVSPIDKVFFAASHNRPDVTVEPIDVDEVVRRMVFSLGEEQLGLRSYYLKYRFAFPEKFNYWLDNMERVQTELLSKALDGKEAYAIYHPYPVHIPRLFDAIQPYLS